jgi:CHAD domain-containing protein
LSIQNASFVKWLKNRRLRRRTLHRAVVTVLQRGDFARARRLLGAILILPAKPNKTADLAKFARRCVESARNLVDEHRDAEPTDVEGLHELRIAYKGLRYTVETFADVLPADLKALREPAVKMQKLLGDIHDVDVALAITARARGLDIASRDHVQSALNARRAVKISEFTIAMHPAPPIEEAPIAKTPTTSPPKKRATRRRPKRVS